MSDAAQVQDVQDLRARLRARLRQVIGQPAVEDKELAAFDVVMSRRQFLKATQYTAIAGLVAAGTPPTLWGTRDQALAVDPKDVGLTAADQDSATVATQLTVGTELFEDTVYAKPFVSVEAVNSHALIEGARGRLRLQSDLRSNDPTEAAFLDAGYHWGPPELLQLEEPSPGEWQLVHYHHPWGSRTDGATTDGMVRDVIMTAADGLVNPTKVLTISSPYNNRFTTGPAQAAGVAYLVMVEDAQSSEGGHVCMGLGAWSITPPYSERQAYPLRWRSFGLASLLHNVEGHELWSSDKYSHVAYPNADEPNAYDPAKATEHIVLYYDNGIKILTLADAGTPGLADLMIDELPYPDDTVSEGVRPRVAHLDWEIADPDIPQSFRLTWVALVASSTANDTSTFTMWTIGHDSSKIVKYCRDGPDGTVSCTEFPSLWAPFAVRWNNTYDVNGYTKTVTSGSAAVLPPQRQQLNYRDMWDVIGLYNVLDDTGQWVHVKMARFINPDAIALFAIVNERGQPSVAFRLAAGFPLAMPDAAGVGWMTRLSGGVSKFGGFRFVASDADGNVFMLRQRHLPDADAPYPPPIYGQYDADGNPRTHYSTTVRDPLPPNTSVSSNLLDLDLWVESSEHDAPSPIATFNVLLNAAVAFGTVVTDATQGTIATNASQGAWLGNGYQAAYAPRRFAHDSVHVEVKRAQGSSTDYASYLAFCNPLTKTWRTRQITSQPRKLPDTPGLSESGDHYQATVAGVNTYGRPVSLSSADNANLLIEVRADAPTLVVDDTHNLYYDVDRYTSFMAAPDPSTGQLALVVKAEAFAQVLYVRLVDTSGLRPSDGDAAMLSSPDETTYPGWQTVNMAAEAQQRMGNDGTPAVLSLLGDAAPVKDTAQYISGPDLYNKGDAANWTYKQGFGPPSNADSANLANLATYLNTSGQNLIAATPQLSAGAAVDGTPIDPLTAVTAVPTSGLATGTTTFTYPGGTIGQGASVTTAGGPRLGSIWSGISHALHDALRWLQHVDADVYKDFKEGAVAVEMASDSITCIVKADIMKAVNGVDTELKEIVSTVEEYANVLANLVVTIVEQSFLFRMIEELIALISLFIHLQDVLDLSTSMKSMMCNILCDATCHDDRYATCHDDRYATYAPASVDDSYSTWDRVGDYFGADSNVSDQFASDDDAIGGDLATKLLGPIMGNPFTRKILNAIMKVVGDAANAAASALPLQFNVDNFEDAAETLAEGLGDLAATVGKDMAAVADALINDLLADLVDPNQLYADLTSGAGLEAIAQQIETDVDTIVEDAFDLLDSYVQGASPQYVDVLRDVLGQNGLLTVDLRLLADLLRLFGIGSVSGGTVSVDADDAIFFPLAVITWVTMYMKEGKSISDISAIFPPPAATVDPGTVGASATAAAYVRLGVNYVLTELIAGAWTIGADLRVAGKAGTAGQKLIGAAGAYLNGIRWINEIWYLVYLRESASQQNPSVFQIVWTAARSVTAVFKIAFTWKGTRTYDTAITIANVLLNLAMVIDSLIEFEVNGERTTDAWLQIVGQELPRTQVFATSLFDAIAPNNPDASTQLPLYAIVALALPFGFVLQELVLDGTIKSADGPGNDNPNRQGPPPGRPRRPDTPPGLQRRSTLPPGQRRRPEPPPGSQRG